MHTLTSKFKNKLTLFFATGFWIGYIPIVPATFGTLIGIPLFFVLSLLGLKLRLILIIPLTLFAIIMSERAEKLLGVTDPRPVVIDEIVGYAIGTLFVPFTLTTVIVGFVLFRIFDIWKPYPVYQSQKLGGGLGIVIDDVLAGIYVAILMKLFF